MKYKIYFTLRCVPLELSCEQKSWKCLRCLPELHAMSSLRDNSGKGLGRTWSSLRIDFLISSQTFLMNVKEFLASREIQWLIAFGFFACVYLSNLRNFIDTSSDPGIRYFVSLSQNLQLPIHASSILVVFLCCSLRNISSEILNKIF